MAKTRGPHLANNQEKSEVLSPTGHEELNSVNSCVSLKVSPSSELWAECLCTPKFRCQSPNPNVIGGEAFGGCLGLDEVTRVKPLLVELMPYKKRTRHEKVLSLPALCEDAVRRRPSASQEVGSHQTANVPAPWC